MAALSVAATACTAPEEVSSASPSPMGTPSPFERVRAWAGGVERYGFATDVSLSEAGRSTTVRLEGSIRETGDGVPDLFASIRSDDGNLELLRLGGRIWVRLPPVHEWTPTPQTPEDAVGVPTTSLTEILEALDDATVEGADEGWTVTGSVPARTMGLPGEGQVELTLVLGPDAALSRYAYETELRVGAGGGDRRVDLEVRTELTDVGEAVDLPTPPPD